MKSETKRAETYGVCWGDGPGVVEECGSRLTATGRAIDVIRDGEADAVDVVELEGSGPVYASDGSRIADHHAPHQTVESWTLWTGPTTDKRVAIKTYER